jgi:hypothetical protein
VAAQDDAPDRWQYVAPTSMTVTGRMTDRLLAEASGTAQSVANPGLFWTIGDSGNPPELLAVDSTGTLRGRVVIRGAVNVDWESVALGPCGQARCVYIADTGDNGERRSEVRLYRLVEPSLPADGATISRTAESLGLRYPDHPHDVEATGVAPDGSILLVTKGRSGSILAFTVPAGAWLGGGSVIATLLDTLPVTPRMGSGRAVTGLAMTPQGERVAVRTYREVYLFRRDAATGRLTPAAWTACNILGAEPQGEGISWFGNDWRFLLLSERGLFASGTVVVVECRPAR